MINEINEKSWCVNAFHGMSANNDGSTKMCCMIQGHYDQLDRSNKWDLNSTSIIENFNNPGAEKIRQNLSNGIRDKACTLCWQEEDGGRKSKRVRDNEIYFHNIKWNGMQPYESIAKIELNLGNTCNIKCRTCHASISSTWMKEEYDLNHSTNTTFKIYADAMKKYHKTYDEESPFWEDLKQNLSTIRQFDFYGGEPLLSKKMWEILKICVDKGYAKDIELHYNTNGTIWPKETELWKNFKSVNLSFSIDGVNERFEYMRFPANWKEVFENMQTARQFAIDNKNTSLSWCITISSINVYYLPETIGEYYKHFSDFGIYLNLVHGPLHFNVSKIHPEVKKHVVEQLNNIPKEYTQVWYQIPGIIGFIENGNFDSNLWNSLFKILATHDEYRDQSFENTFPEYAQVIKSLENVNE